MMRRFLENPYLILALRIGFGVMYLVACYDKIVNVDKFAIAVDNYHFLPNMLVNLWAIALPWIELGIGLLLIAGVFTEASALISAALCVAFIIALTYAMARGYDIACGCFNTDAGAEKISAWLLIRDVFLLLGSLWMLFYNTGRFSLVSLFSGKEEIKGVSR